jgi:hypothetical protein
MVNGEWSIGLPIHHSPFTTHNSQKLIMSKNFLPLLLSVCLPLFLCAQETAKKAKSNCGCSFSSINQVGMLEGSAGTSFQLQTVNGVKYKTWFAGVGVGIDRYRFRTVPLFFDLRKDFSKQANTAFAYGDIGMQFPWIEDKHKLEWGTNEFKAGLYYDAGLGYKITLGKGRNLLFSGGISLKKLRETRFYDVVCVRAPCPLQNETFDFSLKRFSAKVGLQL